MENVEVVIKVHDTKEDVHYAANITFTKAAIEDYSKLKEYRYDAIVSLIKLALDNNSLVIHDT